jgi:YVTN family beta-propeller protein
MSRTTKFKILGTCCFALVAISTAVLLYYAAETTSGVVNTTVGANPSALAVNPVTNKTYIANAGSNTVSVLDVPTNSTEAVPVGTNPVAVGVNPVTNTIYVANEGSNNVTAINGAMNTVIATITVGSGPEALAVDPLNNFVYVTDYGSGTVSVINNGSNSFTGSRG